MINALDQMVPFHILLDEMGLDQMGLDKVRRPHTLLYWYEFILLFCCGTKCSIVIPSVYKGCMAVVAEQKHDQGTEAP